MKNKIESEISQKFREESFEKISIRTDKMFAYIFGFQWVLGIALALWISPTEVNIDNFLLHPNLLIAIFIGGITASLPIFLILIDPGNSINRLVVAIAQMMFSALFIHLTGGRIETHFHIFGSLAFLAFYRDYRPLLLATAITGLDHILRGVFVPQDIYGVLSVTPYRALEHIFWVLFEDVFLVISIKNGISGINETAISRARVAVTLQNVEHMVLERTLELEASKKIILEQQDTLVSSAKMSALGEMAGGVAHEINTPLAIINMRVEQLEECIADKSYTEDEVKETLEIVRKTTNRIAQIVNGLRMIARDGSRTPFSNMSVDSLIEDTLSFCRERFSNHGVDISVLRDPDCIGKTIECRSVEISQVLLNLMNNAFDAIEHLPQKWVRIEVRDHDPCIEISVVDCGMGISPEVRSKIMQPFFTTKGVGKGTGLGLSISNGIVEAHQGKFYVDGHSTNTKFTILLPKKQVQQNRSVA